MRIGILCERLLQGFGVDLMVHEHASALASRGHSVSVFTLRADDSLPPSGYQVIRVESPLLASTLATERALVERHRRYFALRDVDVWISYTYPFHALIPFLRAPTVVIDAGTSSAEGMSRRRRFEFFLQRVFDRWVFFPFAWRIVAISRYVAGQVPWCLRRRTLSIHLGVDHLVRGHRTRPDALEDLREALRLSPKDFVLLYVGRLEHDEQPYKGVDALLRVFDRVRRDQPNVKLIMAGFGGTRAKRELQARGVVALPNVASSKLRELYEITDLYVSASRWEGFNLPMMEAQSFGKPPLVLDIGAHAELIHHGADGFLARTEAAFEETIRDLAVDRPRLELAGSAARENAALLPWSRNVDELLGVLEPLSKPEPQGKGAVTAVAVNYNGESLLPRLLGSLRESDYERLSVTVVDNASSDGSRELVERAFPEVRLIASHRNRLFAGGTNLGTLEADGEFLLLVNTDVEVEPDAIRHLVERIESDPEIAAVVPKIYFERGSPIVESVGVGLTAELAAFNRGIGQPDLGQFDESEQIFGACFACVLVRRGIYQKLWSLDERFGAYYEDIDWSYRANLAGYRVATEPRAVAYHSHGATTRNKPPEWKTALIERNRIWTILKNCEGPRARRLLRQRTQALWGSRQSPSVTANGRAIVRSALAGAPFVLAARRKVQRLRTISDERILERAEGARPFFDDRSYEPLRTMENLSASLRQLSRMDETNATLSAEADALAGVSLEDRDLSWMARAEDLLASLATRLGDREASAFRRAILRDDRKGAVS